MYIVEDPTIIISPMDPIEGLMLGSPLVINCTVITVNGVEADSVTVSWSGPGIETNRVNPGPTISEGNIYTKNLEIVYITESDERAPPYFCIVMILGVSESKSVVLRALSCKYVSAEIIFLVSCN